MKDIVASDDRLVVFVANPPNGLRPATILESDLESPTPRKAGKLAADLDVGVLLTDGPQFQRGAIIWPTSCG